MENNRTKSLEKNYRTLFNLSPGGLLLEDLEGNILDVNPAFCNSLGYTHDELVGKNVYMLAHPDHKPQVKKNLKLLGEGQVLTHSVKSIRKDGSPCFMDLSEIKIPLPDGTQGILSVAKDITDQKRAEEERLQKEKMKSIIEIAGAVCHELNQPMTVVSVTCDLLMMNELDSHEVFEKVKVIKNQLKRMNGMTQKLMHLTRYETREYVKGSTILDLDRASG